jgi:uncharacterized integral membrane protein (TIGR02327 family)
MISAIGPFALTSIISHLAFISLAWWALQALKFDNLLRANRVLQARVLYILTSIALGSTISNFFLDYLQWSQQLPLILQIINN